MKPAFTAWIIAMIFLPLISLASDTSPLFTTLPEALVFIDNALDNEDWKGLENALFPSFKEGEPNRTSWKQLKQVRGDRRLVEIYKNMDFDSSKNSFQIGNCGAEISDKKALPHTWISFVKDKDGWRLNRIWGCR